MDGMTIIILILVKLHGVNFFEGHLFSVPQFLSKPKQKYKYNYRKEVKDMIYPKDIPYLKTLNKYQFVTNVKERDIILTNDVFYWEEDYLPEKYPEKKYIKRMVLAK
jgi:hypothetical protein